MAIVTPFKATRAQSDIVEHVVSDSFQNYSKEEIVSILKTNPYSFLNILCPKNVDYSNEDPTEKFKRIHETFNSFYLNKTFSKDDKAYYYLYQINTPNGENTTGFIAAASTEDYRNGTIKKHEHTIHSREVLFKDYLNTVKFNAEPVLMTYKSVPDLELIIEKYTNSETEYQFQDSSKLNHKLWLVSNNSDINTVTNAFKEIDHLYIADGHHRSASSSLLALEQKSEAHQSFMVYLIPESKLKIKAFNRFIKDLNQFSPTDILSRLRQNYEIVKICSSEINTSLQQNEFIMCISDAIYHLTLKPQHAPSDVLSNLNTQLLYDTILRPIIGIEDIRNNKRIEYIEDKEIPSRFYETYTKNNFKIGFKMAPISIETLKEIANKDLVMPPKSTFIEPKLKSGLIIYNL